jgi:hypothetical protein
MHAHLTELGVDLAAICFSWFLSLFTDCLPVEVSFLSKLIYDLGDINVCSLSDFVQSLGCFPHGWT